MNVNQFALFVWPDSDAFKWQINCGPSKKKFTTTTESHSLKLHGICYDIRLGTSSANFRQRLILMCANVEGIYFCLTFNWMFSLPWSRENVNEAIFQLKYVDLIIFSTQTGRFSNHKILIIYHSYPLNCGSLILDLRDGTQNRVVYRVKLWAFLIKVSSVKWRWTTSCGLF